MPSALALRAAPGKSRRVTPNERLRMAPYSGANHHRADNQNLRVGENSDRSDEPGNDEQRKPTGRECSLQPDPRFNLRPDRRELLEPAAASRHAIGERGDRRVDILQNDRPSLIDPTIAQAPDHLISRALWHIEKQGVTIWITHRSGEHCQIHDCWLGLQCRHQRLGEVGRADHS